MRAAPRPLKQNARRAGDECQIVDTRPLELPPTRLWVDVGRHVWAPAEDRVRTYAPAVRFPTLRATEPDPVRVLDAIDNAINLVPILDRPPDETEAVIRVDELAEPHFARAATPARTPCVTSVSSFAVRVAHVDTSRETKRSLTSAPGRCG